MAIDRFEEPTGGVRAARGFLRGRTALVTGGARRIGRALAVALAGEGASVVIHYRESGSAASQLAASIQADGGTAALVEGELADPGVAIGLVSVAAEAIGRPVDLLVNNASTFAQGSALDTTVEQWDLNQAVNLRAPFLLAQGLVRSLPKKGPADIINLNDYRALRPGADHFAYTISKAGLHGLTHSLALALAPRVRVNELALGAVLPPEKAPADYMHTLRDEIPTGRFSSTAEVAGAMLFLLENQGVTGQTVCIDGGRHLV